MYNSCHTVCLIIIIDQFYVIIWSRKFGTLVWDITSTHTDSSNKAAEKDQALLHTLALLMILASNEWFSMHGSALKIIYIVLYLASPSLSRTTFSIEGAEHETTLRTRDLAWLTQLVATVLIVVDHRHQLDIMGGGVTDCQRVPSDRCHGLIIFWEIL